MDTVDLEIGDVDDAKPQQALGPPSSQISINFIMLGLVIGCFLVTLVLFLAAGAPTVFLGRLT